MEKWISRKLIVAVGGMVGAVLVQVGLPENIASQITDAIVYIASAYLIGQGAVDVAEKLKK